MPGCFRTNLVSGDPLRNWTAVWDRGGRLPEFLWLNGSAGPIAGLGGDCLGRTQNGTAHHRRVVLPGGLPPGQYTLDCGQAGTVPLAVAAATERHVTSVPGGWPTSTVQKIMDNGHDVTLGPGEHVWDRAVTMPPGSSIRGYGAFVRRTPDGDYGERVIVPGDNCTVEGITFDCPGLLFHANPPTRGLVVRRVTFLGVDFGYGPREVLVDSCDLAGSVTSAMPGLWWRTTIRDTPAGGVAWYGGAGYAGDLALIDVDFHDTDRGPCFANGCTDCLFNCVRVWNVNRGNNGNESFGAEAGPLGGEFSRNLILSYRYWNSEGAAVNFWDAACRDNLFRDFSADGGFGVWLAGWNGAVQTGNVFEQFELRNGAGFTFGHPASPGTTKGATGNDASKGAVVGWKPTRSNQTYYDAKFYARKAAVESVPGAVNLPPATVEEAEVA